jgi:hypothetical protein
MLLSEQIFDMCDDVADSPLRIIGGKVALLEMENEGLRARLAACEMALRVAHLPTPPYEALGYE